MKNLSLTFFTVSLCASVLHAQAPFTDSLYGWYIEKDLVYGLDTNYAGIPVQLTLDLYKPLGDGNTERPLLVFAHGGFMLTGCKEGVAWFAEEMTQRGYAVACINYRKGWHKDDYVPAPNCLLSFLGADVRCLYAADSSELIRAVYRGQQDMKGAIRWLKARAAQDSICPRKVLAGGESAGAIVALSAAFLDRPEEKPLSCYDIVNAPPPDANLVNCYEENCVMQTIVPSGAALLRPDLGPVDGSLNLNGFDAGVIGVISFYGGVPYEAASKDWLQGPDTPAVYFYHQTCDGVVPFNYGQPVYAISAYCNLGCTPWHSNYAHFYGNGAIAAAFQSGAQPPLFTTDFSDCQAFVPELALFECNRFANNGAYHYVIDRPARAQNIAGFFSPVVSAISCTVAAQEPDEVLQARLSPNPFGQRLSVYLKNAPEGEAYISLTDLSGKILWSDVRMLQAGENILFEQNHFPKGMYVLHIHSKAGAGVWKVVRE